MAQHYPLESWKDESWYKELTQSIQHWVSKVSYSIRPNPTNEIKFINRWIEQLPDFYKTNLDSKIKFVLLYKPSIKKNLDKDNDYPLNTLRVEIHLDKNKKILKTYIPL